MAHISPGVYSRIIPLESYVQEVPGNVGLMALIAPKGPDNKLHFIGSLKQLDELYGKPSLSKYGKFAHAHIIARNYMSINPSMYAIRVLPEDATYASAIVYDFFKKPDMVTSNGFPVYLSKPIQYVVSRRPLTKAEKQTLFKGFNNNVILSDKPDNKEDVIPKPVLAVPDEEMPDIVTYVKPVEHGNYVVFDSMSYRFKKLAENETIYRGIIVQNSKGEYLVYDGNRLTPINNEMFKEVRPTLFYNNNGFYTLKYVEDKTNLPNDVSDYSYVFEKVPVSKYNAENYYYSSHAIYAFVSKYRGEWYNNVGLGFELFENNTDYVLLDTYEKTKDGIYLKEQYNVTFNPDGVDESFNSIYIKEILDKYNHDLDIEIEDDAYLDKTRLHANNLKFVKSIEDIYMYYDKASAGTDNIVLPVAKVIESLSDVTKDGIYFVAAKSQGLYNYEGKIVEISIIGSNKHHIYERFDQVPFGAIIHDLENDKLYIHAGNGLLYDFDPYLYSLFGYNKFFDKVLLDGGSDGSLLNNYGTIEYDTAVQLLSKAFIGELDNDIINTEKVWIDLVFDGGFPTEVKTQIVKLTSELRRDCIAILDNNDNPDAETAIQTRNTENYFNTEYAALYEPYIKIYYPDLGRNIWISPVYSVAKLIALNDRINEVWYAVAGFERGFDSEIRDLRYSPTIGERDQFYLNQINPFVIFKEGKVLWGQLTTRRKTDPLQDLNIMRLILYVKRAIEQFSKYQLFEFIDNTTLQIIENAIKDFLTDVKRRRGLYDFKVKVYATEYMKKRKFAKADILLYPTRVLERLFIDFFIK